MLATAGCDPGDRVGDDTLAAAPARRIVALSPHLAELVFAAGAGDRLVGVVEFSDFPPAVRDLPRVGDAFRLDYEVLAGLEPDLVLAWRSGTPADVQDRLRALGYRVVPLDANRLGDIASQLVAIGKLAGTDAVAAAAADDYARRLAGLRERYRDARPVSVFYQVSARPLFTISGRHVISEAIETCGGRNVFAGIDGLSPAVSLESVVAAAPDAIIAGDDSLAGGAVEVLAAQWADWPSIPAVRGGHIYVVDSDRMHRQTTRILDAIEALCAKLDEARQLTARSY